MPIVRFHEREWWEFLRWVRQIAQFILCDHGAEVQFSAALAHAEPRCTSVGKLRVKSRLQERPNPAGATKPTKLPRDPDQLNLSLAKDPPTRDTECAAAEPGQGGGGA